MEKAVLVLGFVALLACDRSRAMKAPARQFSVEDLELGFEKTCIDGEILVKFAEGFMPLYDEFGYPVMCQDVRRALETKPDILPVDKD